MNEYGKRKTAKSQNITWPSDRIALISLSSMLTQENGIKATTTDTAQITSSALKAVFLFTARYFTGEMIDRYFSVVAATI